MSGQEGPLEVETDLAFALVPEWVLVSRLSPGAKVLYAVLALHADRRRGTAWPSVDRLADIAGSSSSGVRRAMRELERFGAVSRQARFDHSKRAPRQTSNLYTVHRTHPSTRVGLRKPASRTSVKPTSRTGGGVTGGPPQERPARGGGVSPVTGGGVSPVTGGGVSPVTPHINQNQKEPEKSATQSATHSATHSVGAPEARATASEAESEPKSLHHRLIALWCQGYLEHRGAKYVFQPNRDGPAIKRLIASGVTEDDFRGRVQRGFAHEFWAPKLGSIAALCGPAWNHLAPTPAEIEAERQARAKAERDRAEAIKGEIRFAEYVAPHIEGFLNGEPESIAVIRSGALEGETIEQTFSRLRVRLQRVQEYVQAHGL